MGFIVNIIQNLIPGVIGDGPSPGDTTAWLWQDDTTLNWQDDTEILTEE